MTPRISPAPRSPRLATLTQPASSLIAPRFAQTMLSGENAYKARIVKRSSGVGDSARGAREKSRQVIAEADHPRLACLRALGLWPAPRLGLRCREHDHGRLGILRAPLGWSRPLGTMGAAIGPAR